MNVFITGGAGFLGSHLAAYHLNLGHYVHVLDDFSTGKLENIQSLLQNSHFQLTEGDLLTCPDLEKIVHWSDRIYHMAAIVGVFRVLERPMQVLDENIMTTKRLLNALPKKNAKQHLIFASSSEVYGSDPKPYQETDNLSIGSPKHFRNNYTISKLTDEAWILSHCDKYAIKHTILRIFNTIGPNQTGHYGMVVPRFIAAAIRQEPLCVYGSGEQTRSFCDVRDFVRLVDKLALNPQAIGAIVNIGHDREISILKLAKLIIKLAKSHSEIQLMPYSEVYGENYQDIMFRRPDLTYLQSLTNHEPFAWSLEKTILDLIRLSHNISSLF